MELKVYVATSTPNYFSRRILGRMEECRIPGGIPLKKYCFGKILLLLSFLSPLDLVAIY